MSVSMYHHVQHKEDLGSFTCKNLDEDSNRTVTLDIATDEVEYTAFLNLKQVRELHEVLTQYLINEIGKPIPEVAVL